MITDIFEIIFKFCLCYTKVTGDHATGLYSGDDVLVHVALGTFRLDCRSCLQDVSRIGVKVLGFVNFKPVTFPESLLFMLVSGRMGSSYSEMCM